MRRYVGLVNLAALIVAARRKRHAQRCLHGVNAYGIMDPVIDSTDRLVLVPVTQLDDLLELARLVASRVPETDPLHAALIGAVGAVRQSAIPEP